MFKVGSKAGPITATKLLTLTLGAGVALGGCGITVKRDLSATQPGAVVYDDLCELQDYFDALHDTT
ncbi:MAG TPA: hypothetical protein VGG33_24835, partial [Polyangia bacterium]